MHYSDVAGDPVLFLELTPESLQRRHREPALGCGAAPGLDVSFVRQQDEGRTDVCHHDVRGLTRGQARRLARAFALEELGVCDAATDQDSRVTRDLMNELARSAAARQARLAARVQPQETPPGRRASGGE